MGAGSTAKLLLRLALGARQRWRAGLPAGVLPPYHSPPPIEHEHTAARTPAALLSGVYDEQRFRGLDYVVASAGRHGVRLVLCLGNFWCV